MAHNRNHRQSLLWYHPTRNSKILWDAYKIPTWLWWGDNSILNQAGPSNARTTHSARNFDFNAFNNTCVEKKVLPQFECLFHLQTHQPHGFSCFRFCISQQPSGRCGRFSNSSFPQERWKWSPTSSASAASAAASPRCIDIHCWKVLRLEPKHEGLEDDLLLFQVSDSFSVPCSFSWNFL